MQIERTKNTARNMLWGLIEKLLQLVLPFVTRTLILKLIGEQYLGLNSLFTSIISVLNLADLGFGTAITFSMYKPIADNDEHKLCALLGYYKTIYRVIGGIVLGVGIAIMPFLKHLITGEVPNDINLYLLYSIYLLNTVLSYWLFAYKKSLIHAYHRDDVSTKISVSLLILQYGLQIGLLFLFDNYYLYILILPVITLFNNILTAIVAKKMFPSLICRGKVDEITRKDIKRRVGGAFIGKFCGVTRNSLDSIFISSFFGLTLVAIYGNYYYILTAVHGLLTIVTVAMASGVGNSIAKESVEKNYQDFENFTFLYSWISGWFACCLLCLYQPFMQIWVGEDLMFSSSIMILFPIYLYVMAASDIKNVYYTACGLWWEGRWRAALEFGLNLILNYFGAKYLGVAGIMLATIITMIGVNFIYGTQILFKYYFSKQKLSKYLLKQLLYLAVTSLMAISTYFVCSLLPKSGILYFFLKGIICIILPNLFYFLVYFKTGIFRRAMALFKNLISIVIKKRS